MKTVNAGKTYQTVLVNQTKLFKSHDKFNQIKDNINIGLDFSYVLLDLNILRIFIFEFVCRSVCSGQLCLAKIKTARLRWAIKITIMCKIFLNNYSGYLVNVMIIPLCSMLDCFIK